jgi:hypothetical protein
VWVESLVDILKLQSLFLHELGGLEPKWLTRHRAFCKRRRELEMQILVKGRFCTFMEAAIERDREYERFIPPREKILEIEVLKLAVLKAELAALEVGSCTAREVHVLYAAPSHLMCILSGY